MENISFTKAAKAIRALGFRVSRDADGEIRVGFPGNESAAYYTTDPADALGTAQAMREQADAGAVPVTDPEGEAVESGEHIAGEPWDGPAAFDAEPETLDAETLEALTRSAESHADFFDVPGAERAEHIARRVAVLRANILCGYKWNGDALEPGADPLDALPDCDCLECGNGFDSRGGTLQICPNCYPILREIAEAGEPEPVRENPARAMLSRVVNRCIADGSPIVREIPAPEPVLIDSRGSLELFRDGDSLIVKTAGWFEPSASGSLDAARDFFELQTANRHAGIYRLSGSQAATVKAWSREFS